VVTSDVETGTETAHSSLGAYAIPR